MLVAGFMIHKQQAGKKYTWKQVDSDIYYEL